MRYRYKCPNCKADLHAAPPSPTRHAWYKPVSRHTLQCPSCGAELEKRFADYDLGMATVFTGCGAISIWGAGKIILPVIAALFAVRLVAGRFLPVYVLSGRVKRG